MSQRELRYLVGIFQVANVYIVLRFTMQVRWSMVGCLRLSPDQVVIREQRSTTSSLLGTVLLSALCLKSTLEYCALQYV